MYPFFRDACTKEEPVGTGSCGFVREVRIKLSLEGLECIVVGG
jgi:hypothetical protein